MSKPTPTLGPEPAIEVMKLTRRFAEMVALNGLTLSVPGGSIFGLLGPNGAGKGTLIKMQTTLLPPTSGTALVTGLDVVRQPQQVRRHIGYVSQMLSADGDLTGYQNLPGGTVVVVGDGAVGLLGVLVARQMGAGRIIAMSRHETRQKLAREFGATDIVAERGDEAVARMKDRTKGVGADSVLECVGTPESMKQAIGATRPGGYVGYVGVPHGVEFKGEELFYRHVHLHGGPAPVRRYLPRLIDLVLNGTINPGKVFDLMLPLDQVAEGYRAMDERRAIKALLRP